MGKTFYDVLAATAKYDGNAGAHSAVIETIRKHGHSLKSTDAWCSETVMSYFFDAGCISIIGGYSNNAPSIKAKAKKLGIWHDGSSGIRPGDIVIYGSTPNHTEFAIGDDLNISGNYRGGCSRRKRSGRTINGYVRPKYEVMPVMDNLQYTLCACDVMLGVYGTGTTRERLLTVFGTRNAELIQNEVTRVWENPKARTFDFAVYIIIGRAGNDPYRKKRLGKFATAAQKEVDSIRALRSHSKAQCVQDVMIAGRYGNDAVRAMLLKFNGYNAAEIQKMVNDKMGR